MRLASWVPIAGIVVGALIMMGAGTSRHHTNDLTYAAGVLAGGMIVSSGMISLVILKVFGNNKDEKE